jgi:hypothetical protein
VCGQENWGGARGCALRHANSVCGACKNSGGTKPARASKSGKENVDGGSPCGVTLPVQ